jgi:iron-sulfur cluster repair protein YtfE (RIC family)
MAKSDSIKKMMLKDHGKIFQLLKTVDSEEHQNSEDKKVKFEQFKWELQRHFIVEERAIFTYYDPIDKDGLSMVKKLMGEHKSITGHLTSIEKIIEDDGSFNLDDLTELLMSHKKYEEEFFYPALEEELDSAQKKEMISRIETQI